MENAIAVGQLLRLIDSAHARRKFAQATNELESATNEVNAHLARMDAKQLGRKAPLCATTPFGRRIRSKPHDHHNQTTGAL
jgi:multidrug resistance efflux pump